MIYEVWSEGYIATGGAGEATCHSEGIEGNSFKEACDKLSKIDPEFAKYYDRKRLLYWGCRLFDNRNDARRSFG